MRVSASSMGQMPTVECGFQLPSQKLSGVLKVDSQQIICTIASLVKNRQQRSRYLPFFFSVQRLLGHKDVKTTMYLYSCAQSRRFWSAESVEWMQRRAIPIMLVSSPRWHHKSFGAIAPKNLPISLIDKGTSMPVSLLTKVVKRLRSRATRFAPKN